MKPTSISARLVGLLAALLLIISALAAPPALAKAACNSGAQPTADIALVQAVSVASDGNYVDHLTITNFGPCNVPNAGLTAILPSPLLAFSSNPNSWECAPAAPTSLVATDHPADQGGALDLSWIPSVSTTVTQQRLYRSTIDGGPYALVTTIADNTTTAYKDIGLTANTPYYYVLRAYDGKSESANSNQASATPLNNSAAPVTATTWATATPSVSTSGPGAVTCYETSTIGVPGTADIYLKYAPATGLIDACAETFNSLADLKSCPIFPGAPAIFDPNAANNTSTVAGGLVQPGGTLTYGPGGQPFPSSAFTHTTSVTLANGGVVNIYQTSGCPPSGPSDCFLGTATINFTNVNGQKTWTLTFLASLTKKSLSQITVWNSVGGGAYTALTNCSGKQQTDPCVSSRSKSTIGSDTIYTIVVTGTKDNGMTAD